MILHFVTDEKVTDQIIQNFNRNANGSFFLVFVGHQGLNFRHIKSSTNNITTFFFKDNINDVIEKLNPTAIVIHAFHLDYAKVIIKIKKPIRIAWYAWGFDIYGLPLIKPSIYAPLTTSFLKKHNMLLNIQWKVFKSDFLRKTILNILGKEDRYSIIYQAKKRINYFVSYMQEEYDYYSNFYTNNFKFINCPFSTIDQYLAGSNELFKKNELKKNILIGNSNTIESNHIDVFSIIGRNKKLADIEVFVPLNYGTNNTYKNEVIKKGKQTFGKTFNPIMGFIDRKEYIELLSTCSVGVFYHYRQQAMGNIIPMLYLGARVYLSSRNPTFKFLKKSGMIIFDLDKDFKIYGNECLHASFVETNKKILNNLFSETKVLSRIDDFIDKISK